MSEAELRTGKSRLELSPRNALTRTAPSATNRPLIAEQTRLHGGRYIILEVLGAGGEGVVYRAEDSLRNEEVAIKILHLDDVAAIPQLKREFRFLRDLVHPNLLPLYELVIERELSYFTMSYVRGTDFLKSADSHHSLVPLVIQLADVLCFLHQTGRVHRDVKPSNILVRSTGELVLLDFGIGLDLRARNSNEHAVMGTPRYMAPEVLAMRGASVKSDAYSMGILLYEALTGHHPQASERTQLDQRHGFDPRLANSQLDEKLARLVIALTEPDPERRAGVEYCREVLEERSVSPSSLSSLPPIWAPQFSGRRRELARLFSAKERVKNRGAAFVVRIEADSGMGKSSLLAQFLEGQTDALVLSGRCSEHELLPHKAIDGAILDLIDYLKSQNRQTQLELASELDADILAQLFPEFRMLDFFEGISNEGPRQFDYRAMRQRAYLALSGVLSRIAKRQTLIVAIDDLQWGDLDSGKLLGEVFFGRARPPCLLILSCRGKDAATSECLKEIFARRGDMLDDLSETVISLGPLDVQESKDLVMGVLGEDEEELISKIVAEAGGSPLLLTEMAAHVNAQGTLDSNVPKGEVIESILHDRLSAISAQARDAFALLCCSGRVSDVSLLSELTRLPGGQVVRELEQVRLGRTRQGRLLIEPLHDAIRETYLAGLEEGGASYHLRWAEILVQKGGDPAEIARHFFASGDERTSAWAEMAADAAARAFALSTAIDLYRLALDTAREVERFAPLRRRLADMLAAAGRGAEAAPLYERMADEASMDEAIELRSRAAEQFLITGDAQRGTSILCQVQEAVGLNWPKSGAEAVFALLYHRTRLSTTGQKSIERALRRPQNELLARKLAACRAAWPIAMISVIHGAANSSLYLRLALESGDRGALSVACAMEAIYHAIAGPKGKAKVERWMGYAQNVAMDLPDPYSHAFLKFAVGQNLYLAGDLSGSLKYFRTAEELFLEHGRGVTWELNSARIFWSDALFYLGQHRELDLKLSSWIADAEERGDRYMLSALKMAKAPRTLYRDGRVDEAQTELDEGFALWDSPYVSYHDLSQAVIQTYVDIYRGDAELALSRMPHLKRMMKQSYMDQVHVARVQVGVVEAIVCLEVAADCKDPARRKTLCRRALRLSKMMVNQGATWSTALGMQFEALSGLIEAPNHHSLALLKEAELLFTQAQMTLHAAGASARVAELVGGDEGSDRLDRAHAVFSNADVGDWVATLSCLTPRVLPR